MIKKCEHTGCNQTGKCRAPKSPALNDYWYFCQEHAAEYNKNWNFYSNMTEQEIEADWEKQTFGAPLKDPDTAKKDSDEYAKFINDFLTGRDSFDRVSVNKTPPSKIMSALKVLELTINTTKKEIGTRYRAMAKKHHPDTAKNKNNADLEFVKITDAYKTLIEYYKK